LAAALALFSAEAFADPVDTCRKQTPIPKDAEVIDPGANVPATMAGFSGVWIGVWPDEANKPVLCTTLVVERVHRNGFVELTYSHGTHRPWGIPTPNFYRVVARIDGDAIVFRVRQLGQDLHYRINDNGLSGTLNESHRTEMTRLKSLGDVGCDGGAGAAGLATPERREVFTATAMMASPPAGLGPVHNNRFLPVGQNEPARHAFRGTLHIEAAPLRRTNRGCFSRFNRVIGGVAARFFTHRGRLVPVERELVLQPDGDGWMDMIFGPGRVWSEPGDGEWSRASFPFVITSRYGGSAHNGLATFLYNDTTVSPIQYQIVQETAGWNRWDAWGALQAKYEPGPVAEEAALAAAFERELAARLPVQPLLALPGLPDNVAAALTEDLGGVHASVGGLVVDGTVFRSDCPTRFGVYPYCDEMRHAAFSVTKSMVGALSLLRMAQKYGDEIFDFRIKDFVEVTAEHDGWADVTFENAIDMTSGIARANRKAMKDWGEMLTANGKLNAGFVAPDDPTAPGEIFRYDGILTFALSAALDRLLKQKEGPRANLWTMMQNEVFRPIGIAHLPAARTLEAEPEHRIAFASSGLYPTADTIAKVILLIQNGGRHDGRQLLSAAKTKEILAKSEHQGLPTGAENRFGAKTYFRSFWYEPFGGPGNCRHELPSMRGWGGNVVTVLPNGIGGFRLSDGWEGNIAWIVQASDAIKPMCPPNTAKSDSPKVKERQLRAGDLKSLLVGHTLYGDVWHNYTRSNGTMFSRYRDTYDAGRWQITADGRYCVRRHGWQHGRDICYRFFETDRGVERRRVDDWAAQVVRREIGNPENY
jgi:CubicO group peptidase (beta-lactamase class C family)